ncbi:fractalkine isoform X2 [Diceros bicornis minor]|uniref:fractalkine isoform X2 n=1 Tax=Diceros bicornis minor TaxID=77932 RepID=UPI0026EF3F6A|nr:fractalkine isoform X2 [Diceros bicornis minor]
MAPLPLPWLHRWAALCHLALLLAGQPLAVTKCSRTCDKMTSPIPVSRLIGYRRNEESCRKPAIIFETIKHRFFCADPEETWVRKAMEHLDGRASALNQSGGTFEKQIGVSTPRTTPATRGMDTSLDSEPKATEKSGSQEAQRALGTSPELPPGVAGSWGTTSLSTSKAPDGGPRAGPKRTELLNTAAATTATSWQSSAAYQPGSGLWAERKASDAPSTQAPSTETLPTQTLSTQASIISRTAQEDNVGPEGKSVWIKGQNPMPENSLGPKKMGPLSAHTDAFLGPGSMPHVSMVPVFSDGAPSREPVASGSWAPKAEEPIHATVDPQKLSVIITPVPDSQAATRRQAVGLLAFLGLLFCLGVAMFAYQSLQGCPRKVVGDIVEGLRYVPQRCGSNSYVLVPV